MPLARIVLLVVAIVAALTSLAAAQSTELVSNASSAPPGFWTNSDSAAISGDGRSIAFESQAQLIAGVGGAQVYVQDRVTSSTELVSRASGASGAAGNAL